MPLLTLILVIVAVGVVLWAVNRFIPMEANIKTILNATVAVALVLWILSLFGVFQLVQGVRVGQ
jgi:hypothetical protein